MFSIFQFLTLYQFSNCTRLVFTVLQSFQFSKFQFNFQLTIFLNSQFFIPMILFLIHPKFQTHSVSKLWIRWLAKPRPVPSKTTLRFSFFLENIGLANFPTPLNSVLITFVVLIVRNVLPATSGSGVAATVFQDYIRSPWISFSWVRSCNYLRRVKMSNTIPVSRWWLNARWLSSRLIFP